MDRVCYLKVYAMTIPPHTKAEERVRVRHRVVPIAGVGHSGCAVFQSPEALAAML